MYRKVWKRFFDFVISLTAITLISPLFVFIVISLLIANRGSVFFVQSRIGFNLRVFKIIKFKTMSDLKDSSGALLPDARRLTKIGSFIRRTSLDELPQLFNVLCGQMSLIGPRPLLVEYVPLYSTFQNRRHEVRPGITGWAQVNGRNAIKWEEKFKLDVFYVDHLNFSLDLKILLLTVMKVIRSEGISATDHATMEYFKGNEKETN